MKALLTDINGRCLKEVESLYFYFLGRSVLQVLHCDRLIKEEVRLLSDLPMYCAAVPESNVNGNKLR
jgi:hypothetical protein